MTAVEDPTVAKADKNPIGAANEHNNRIQTNEIPNILIR